MERDQGKTPKFCWQDAVLEDSSTANICLLSGKKDESEGRTMRPESGAKSHRIIPELWKQIQELQAWLQFRTAVDKLLSVLHFSCLQKGDASSSHAWSLPPLCAGCTGADNSSSVLPVHRWRALYQKPRSHLILIY